MDDTSIHKVNSDDGREVAWHNGYSHILVGGDKLNRGYTVQGLTVTYMPRSPGSWTADTIQQRARFFGYKRSYLPLCRVFLHPKINTAYREYVEHEEDIRTQLSEHAGRPLREWKRAFILGHRQKPTRTNVLSESIHKPKHTAWYRQNHPHASAQMLAHNRALRERLFAAVDGTLAPDEKFPQHSYGTAPLGKVFEEVLVDYECFGADAIDWTAMRLWIADLLNRYPDAECTVYSMQHGDQRKRTEEQPDRVTLFQGRSSSKKEGSYPGDEKFLNAKHVTLQLHRLKVETLDGRTIEDVPSIAASLPSSFMPKDVVIQPKKGQ